MSNTILGAGMLALPHALAQSGLLVGLLLLALFAALSLLGLHLLSAAADLAGRPSSFYAVAEKAVPGSGLLIDAAIAVKCFGVATAYLIIVGDAMPQAVEAFGATGLLLDRRTWTLGAAVLVSPLAYLKQIDALRHTSLLALLSVLFVTVLVLLFALRPGAGFDPCAGPRRPPAAPCRGANPNPNPNPNPNHNPNPNQAARRAVPRRRASRHLHGRDAGRAADVRLLLHVPPEHHLGDQRAPGADTAPRPYRHRHRRRAGLRAVRRARYGLILTLTLTLTLT